MAYDVTGTQQFVVRGGVGLYFDRPAATRRRPGARRPTVIRLMTVRYSQLQTLGSGGLTTQAPPQLTAYQYRRRSCRPSLQWNVGVQMMLPWSIVVRRGLRRPAQLQRRSRQPVNINAIDFGPAFRAKQQDPTLAPSAMPGPRRSRPSIPTWCAAIAATARSPDVSTTAGGRSTRSQFSINRRFRNGLQFGFNDTIVLSDCQRRAAARARAGRHGRCARRSGRRRRICSATTVHAAHN